VLSVGGIDCASAGNCGQSAEAPDVASLHMKRVRLSRPPSLAIVTPLPTDYGFSTHTHTRRTAAEDALHPSRVGRRSESGAVAVTNRDGSPAVRRRLARVSVVLVGVVVGLSLLAGTGVVGSAQAAAPDCSTVSFEGSGTAADPFRVATLDQLQCIGQTPGTGPNDGDYYELQNDIDASETATWNGGSGFEPLGGDLVFSGTVDGNGFVISNLHIDRPDRQYVGLVGFFSDFRRDNVSLEDIRLESVDITGSESVGGLVGSNGGTVRNSSVSGSITGTGTGIREPNVGGLAGTSSGDVRTVSVTASVTGSDRVGGLVGYVTGGTVTDSSATGSVTGSDRVGGLVGENRENVHNSSASGSVGGSEYVGGLIGLNLDEVRGSSATGSVVGSRYVGGFAGENRDDIAPSYGGDVRNSSASGSVDGSQFVGGFVGSNNDGKMTDLSASGSVDGSEIVGGFVGSNNDGTMRNASATGDVTSGESTVVGGFAGSNGGTVNTSVATGSVTGVNQSKIGGFVGVNSGSVNTSSAAGSVSGTNLSDIGGFVGDNSGRMNASYATGNATGVERATVGGFVGSNDGTVNTSYATGSTAASDRSSVGGFAGSNNGTVGGAYATGRATGGGFAGYQTNDGTLVDTYWDSDRSDITTGIGDDFGTADTTRLETPDMEGSESETRMSDLFASGVWTSVAGDYPDLVANPRTVSTPHFDAPTDAEMTTILGDMKTEGGDKIVTSDRALQAINRTSASRSDDYRLGLDIDASGTDEWDGGDGFVPIGFDSEFSGSFDGDGHVVSELYINRTARGLTSVGTFSVASAGSAIEGVGIESANISGYARVGGLVGDNEGGTVRDSYVTGAVTGDAFVGGLVGRYNGDGGTIAESHTAVTVTGRAFVGGLIGDRSGAGSVNRSHATGRVDGNRQVGGLIGADDQGTIRQSYATGNITAIDGRGFSTFQDFGGLIGETTDDSTVTESYATGSITGDSDFVGGLIGRNADSNVTESYATGRVNGTDHVGGLVGQNDGGTVRRSYAIGTVTGTDNVGGAVGNHSGTVDAVYWDTETTGQTESGGSAARYGLSTERMTGLNATVELFEFDFENTWQPAATPGGYPVFASNSAFADKAAAYDGLVDGDGSAEDPYQLSTVYELQLVSERLGEGDSFELTRDIDAAVTAEWFDAGSGPQGFEPLGNDTLGFNGTFDGNGYVVTDLVVNRSRSDGTGLFGTVASRGTLSRVGVESVAVTGNDGVGGLVGNNRGVVRNSSVSGRVDGNRTVGGLVGWNDGGTVRNSSTSGRVNASAGSVGGLIGANYGDVHDSSATGRVTGTDHVGGLLGWSHSGATVTESYATGNVTGSNSQIGGAIGHNNGTVRRVAATGSVDGDGNVGGLVGRQLAAGAIRQSSATGAVEGGDVGGLVGYNGGGSVENTYATGPVNGTNAGGLVGWNQGGEIRLSYAAGHVDGTATSVGGLTGYSSVDGTTEDSYWDNGTTTQPVGVGSTGGTVTNLTGFGAVGDEGPASEMQGLAAVDTMSALDFNATWTAVDGYPLLAWSVDALEFTLATSNLTAGESTDPTVTLTLVDTTTTTATATSAYSSNDTSVATVDDATVRATGAGTALLTAERADVADSASLSVVAAPRQPSSGGGGGSSRPPLELRVTDDRTVEVTGARAGSVVRISDETTATAGSLGERAAVRLDALSVELADDRDFRVSVDTFDGGNASGARSTVSTAFETDTGTLSAGYVTVTHNLEPEDITRATFEFSVRHARLEELGVAPENLTLYRQADGWTALPTDYLGANGTEARFEATSPGFSSFAVGTGEPLTAVTAVTVTDSELFAGDLATVTATVENRGTIAAEQTVTLTANGTTVATEALAVGAGETDEIPLTFRPAAGEYDIAVNGVQSRSPTIVVSPTPEPRTPAVAAGESDRQERTGTVETDGGTPLGVLPVGLVVAGALGGLLWWYRIR